jgi:type I restriction enzyme S subunit
MMRLQSGRRTKASGHVWLGDIPADWTIKRIRFVAKINPSKDEVGNVSGDTEVSFIPMEAVGDDGSLILDRVRRVDEVLSGYTYFREGDVCYAKITPCFENGKGAVMRGLLGGIGFGTTELTVVRPKPTQTISEFLYWMFASAEFRRLGEGTMYGAGGQKRVPDNFLRDFVWGFPPLPEQTAIASFLDREIGKIDALVEEQKRLIELLREKRKAVISHAVTKGLNTDADMKDSEVGWLGEVPQHWTRVQLGRLCSQVSDGPHFSPGYVDEGVMFLSARNVKVDAWSLSDAKFITEEDCADFDRRVVPEKGDVLYTKGGTTGVARVVDLDQRFQVWVHIAVLKIVRSLATPHYVAYALNSTGCYEQSQLYTQGATNNDLGLTRLVKIWLALPPIDEQHEIVAYLDAATSDLDTLVRTGEQSLELLRERRTALISAAVTGKIDVRKAAQPVGLTA